MPQLNFPLNILRLALELIRPTECAGYYKACAILRLIAYVVYRASRPESCYRLLFYLSYPWLQLKPQLTVVSSHTPGEVIGTGAGSHTTGNL